MSVFKPKTAEEAINSLQEFFECDLYTKFRPEKIIKGESWIREDAFTDEGQMYKYLDGHFSILRKEIKELEDKKNG